TLPAETSKHILPLARPKWRLPINNICRVLNPAESRRAQPSNIGREDKMKFGSRPTILGAMGAVVVCLLAVRIASGQAGQQPRPQMSEDVFKNVQVLKGIPVDEFMDTMGMFSASLSLNCIDCHVAESVGTWEKFADETALKRTARRMMLMVNAINKDNFSGVRSVTCYTCHRGDLRPRILPNLAAQYAVPI